MITLTDLAAPLALILALAWIIWSQQHPPTRGAGNRKTRHGRPWF